jgi:hypothetical protein
VVPHLRRHYETVGPGSSAYAGDTETAGRVAAWRNGWQLLGVVSSDISEHVFVSAS